MTRHINTFQVKSKTIIFREIVNKNLLIKEYDVSSVCKTEPSLNEQNGKTTQSLLR